MAAAGAGEQALTNITRANNEPYITDFFTINYFSSTNKQDHSLRKQSTV
jgi:hypothetical protein